MIPKDPILLIVAVVPTDKTHRRSIRRSSAIGDPRLPGGKMESTLQALRAVAALSALLLIQTGCCTIDLTCNSGGCGNSCGPSFAKDPLFDGTLRHRVKGKIHSCANKVACAGGCGEVYWDESINDPAVCDRCDASGNWVGHRGACSPLFVQLSQLWGTPYRASCASSSCSTGSCASGTCVGHGALINHLRGHSDCPSCQQSHGFDHLDGAMEEGVIQHGETIHQGAPSHASPTPAKPRVIESDQSTAPSNAQHRMRLHQRQSQPDPNGKLSAQLVNGHKRLVSNP